MFRRILLLVALLGLALGARYNPGTPITEELLAQCDLRPLVQT